MMGMRSISDPGDLESAWSQQYENLAEQLAKMLPDGERVVVEIGCGRGQLTIPLARRLPAYRIIGLDRFTGPYSESETNLFLAISRSRTKGRIKVVVSDSGPWLKSQPESKHDAIISSEFLPETSSEGMRDFFAECHRVLKAGGFTIHSFLSSQPRNARQKRLIDADTDPKWTKTPPLEWFSPTRKLVLKHLKRAGFRKPHYVRLKSGLVIRSNAARELLKDWDVRQTYWKSHRAILEKEGLEIPDWLIIGGMKS